jgi:protein-disulfide isomerase
MERWFRRWLQPGGVLLAVALGASLVACGDDDDGGPESDGGTPTAQAGGSPTPEAANEIAANLQAIEYPEDVADGLALGNADAPATLEVFEDFQCPFCLRFTAQWEDLLMEYVEAGNLRLLFRNFPILGEESVYAAAAAVCAGEQDAFWEYHRTLFLVQAEAGQHEEERINVGRFNPNALADYADGRESTGRVSRSVSRTRRR